MFVEIPLFEYQYGERQNATVPVETPRPYTSERHATLTDIHFSKK